MDAFRLAEAGFVLHPGRGFDGFLATKIAPGWLGLLHCYTGILAYPTVGFTSLDYLGRSMVCVHHTSYRGGHVWDRVRRKGGTAEAERVSSGEGGAAKELWIFEFDMKP